LITPRLLAHPARHPEFLGPFTGVLTLIMVNAEESTRVTAAIAPAIPVPRIAAGARLGVRGAIRYRPAT